MKRSEMVDLMKKTQDKWLDYVASGVHNPVGFSEFTLHAMLEAGMLPPLKEEWWDCSELPPGYGCEWEPEDEG